LLYVKDVLWYVAPDAARFFDRARVLLKPGGAIYMLQSVPDRPSFVGSDSFPTTFSIAEFLSRDFERVYVSSTYEINSNRVVGNYQKDKYLRFLGRKLPH